MRRYVSLLAFLSVGLWIAFGQSPINPISPSHTAPAMAVPPLESDRVQAAVVPLEATPTPLPTPISTPTPTPAPQPVTGSHIDWMRAAGIPEGDWEYVEWIVNKESGWNHLVWNSAGSGAYGLCQSLPASKMASAGADYMTNPITQLRWCHQYAISRYGGWYEAFLAWGRQGWW